MQIQIDFVISYLTSIHLSVFMHIEKEQKMNLKQLIKMSST